MRILALILILTSIPRAVSAQNYDLKSKTDVRVKGQKPARETRPTRTVIEEPPLRPKKLVREVQVGFADQPIVKWGGELGYGIRTDLADQVKPRLYSHSLSAAYGFQHSPTQISFAAVITAAYESTGERRSEILVDDDRAELFVNDLSLALQKSWKGVSGSKYMITLGNEFPTSPEARREDYKSVTSLALGWSVLMFEKLFTFSLSSELHYIWNSYEYSPATRNLNKQGGWRNEATLRWNIWQGLSVGGRVGSQIARYYDDTNDLTYRNAVSVAYAWSQFSVSLSVSNGTYLDREDANLWFVDEYRRMLSLGTKYSF